MNANGLTNGKSTLVQVMAWCHQATSHYLSQCDPDLCRHMASLGHNALKVKKCGNMADYHLHGEILEREVNIYILGHIQCHRHDTGRDHVFVPSQWEMPLHCNAVSHWLGAYTKRSLHRMIMLLSEDHILFTILYSVCLVRAWSPFQW